MGAGAQAGWRVSEHLRGVRDQPGRGPGQLHRAPVLAYLGSGMLDPNCCVLERNRAAGYRKVQPKPVFEAV